MQAHAKLIAAATAVPVHVIRQQDIARAVEDAFPGVFEAEPKLRLVYRSAGIAKRHTIRPIDWYLEPRSWSEATAAYLQEATALFMQAAGRALSAAGMAAQDIDTIVTISSTGTATPSLEARAAAEMGFRADVQRVPVFGLGCAGGVSGFAIAARLAKASPGSSVLLVAVETCSLAFRLEDASKTNVVATALFGDGAAACILRVDPDGLAEVEMAGEHMWPGSLDIMGWDVRPEGLGVIFAQEIPGFATRHMAEAMTGILHRGGLVPGDVDRFLCHPGGAKVITALETALSLNQGTLDIEREILSEYGNMSAPTVLFVLERALRAGLPARSALTAMGPGFTASCAVLRRAA
ncbi:MAG: type III polyketide synthase [Candidatus Saccharibacteria bacterium]|nr:type III polyketide synthase [Pseudorhodobacter sp.]